MTETPLGTKPDEAAPAAAGKPYGPVGLAVSSIGILAGAGLICATLGAVAFIGSATLLGWSSTLDVLHHFNATLTADDVVADRVNVGAGLIVYAAISAAVLIAARLRGGRAWRDLIGWHRWHPTRRAALFCGLFAVTILFSIGADRVVTYLHPDAKNWMPHPSGTLWQALFVLLAAGLAPVTEELVFRGWLFTSLRATFGAISAVLVCAILFAAAHWESTHLYALAILPVGLALGIVRETTNSIAAPIAFHALYNGFASLLLLTK